VKIIKEEALVEGSLEDINALDKLQLLVYNIYKIYGKERKLIDEPVLAEYVIKSCQENPEASLGERHWLSSK